MLQSKIKTALLSHNLCNDGEHILVAVSGGADSIAMLYLLHALAPELRLRLTVAHLNHGLRGAEADADADFVNATASRLGYPCVSTRTDIRRRARRQNVSLEMSGRNARYEFFVKTARRLHCDAVATAHTADDHVETMLLKLARGAGPQGLCGISRRDEHRGIRIIRPLRDIWRQELLTYLRQHHLEWREDASNTDQVFLRNRVRHASLPMLARQLNPRLRQTLWRTSLIMEQENAWMNELVRPIYHLCRLPDRLPLLNGELLKAYSLAARRRVLRLWLAEAMLPPEALNFEAVQRLEKLLAGRSGHTINLPGGYTVTREYAMLRINPPVSGRKSTVRRHPAPVSDGGFEVTLKIPGLTNAPDGTWQIACTLEPKPAEITGTPVCALVSAARWRRGRITARNWRPGDRMQPFGMRGTRKLQDIYSDLKVPANQRRQLPVLVCRNEIIWTPGYRIADGWAVRPTDRRVLRIRFISDLRFTG
ncbi:MAG: tRNA lysidine(34) synthetase TilS [Kiritimatiellia bacterium]|jgi:tRNA(Ile)-lysidine synthase